MGDNDTLNGRPTVFSLQTQLNGLRLQIAERFHDEQQEMDRRLDKRLSGIEQASLTTLEAIENLPQPGEDGSGTISAPGVFITSKQVIWACCSLGWACCSLGALTLLLALDLDAKTIAGFVFGLFGL